MYSCYGGMLLSWWSLECLNVGDVATRTPKKTQVEFWGLDCGKS
jgi:hypothetical protein